MFAAVSMYYYSLVLLNRGRLTGVPSAMGFYLVKEKQEGMPCISFHFFSFLFLVLCWRDRERASLWHTTPDAWGDQKEKGGRKRKERSPNPDSRIRDIMALPTQSATNPCACACPFLSFIFLLFLCPQGNTGKYFVRWALGTCTPMSVGSAECGIRCTQ